MEPLPAAWPRGGDFPPTICFVKDGRFGSRVVEAGSKEEAIEIWERSAVENPMQADYSAYTTDGSITQGGVKTDAILVVIVDHANGEDSRVLARYQPKKWFKRFAVEPPEMVDDDQIIHLEGSDRDAFFRGLNALGKGLELWADQFPAKS